MSLGMPMWIIPLSGMPSSAGFWRSNGYTVGIISQPDWKDHGEYHVCLGEPRLGFLVSGGNMDSMVNHYSVSKKHRQTDALYAGRRAWDSVRIMRPWFTAI